MLDRDESKKSMRAKSGNIATLNGIEMGSLKTSERNMYT